MALRRAAMAASFSVVGVGWPLTDERAPDVIGACFSTCAHAEFDAQKLTAACTKQAEIAPIVGRHLRESILTGSAIRSLFDRLRAILAIDPSGLSRRKSSIARDSPERRPKRDVSDHGIL
jgi:hypothetical protein